MNKEVSIKDLESVSYFSNEDLVDVVNAAIFLKKPLLIEGPAGTGKTFLAKWNYKKQLLSIQQDKNAENLFDEKYLIKRPILNALTAEKDSLFLIDEIDRSDEEFEALLLEILAENQVTIPEFGTINGNDNRITILTSNGTRELSDALKRRCIYFYLDFPSIDIESKVLMNSIEEISEAQAKSYASFISFVRKLNLNKIPSLIESVEWVIDNFLNKNKSTIYNLGVLLKDKSYQEKYKEQIENANELIQE